MKTVYKNNLNNSARFLLGCKGENPLCVFGINPSTATDISSDQTASKIRKFASKQEYDGYYIFNIYPMRATNPKSLHKFADKKLTFENITIIRNTLLSLSQINIWAAWGNTIEVKPYLLDSLKLITKNLINLNVIWYRCGPLTKQGHPRHPSRLAYNNHFFDFNIEHYIKRHQKV